MRIIIISNPTNITNESSLISEIIYNKLADIHFRKPSFSESDMREYMLKLSPEIRSNIVSHNHPHLSEALNLKGIHFTGNTKHLLSSYKNYKGTKSISTHSLSEISELSECLNYYFLSPIFKSISKQNYGGDSFNNMELKTYLQTNNNKDIIALGGISANNICLCKDMGFKGVALLGSVWQMYEQNKNNKEILHYLENIHKTWEQHNMSE